MISGVAMSTQRRGCSEQAAGGADKRLVGRSFHRAAPGYDAVARLQRRVGDTLLSGLSCEFPPVTVLDVGAGTGYCTGRLIDQFPGSRVVALDLAEGMLHRAREGLGDAGRLGLICADAECLPLADATVDLVLSNLALQWCAGLPAVLTEFRRVLKRGGTVSFSTFGPATLSELREAWAQVDRHTHVLSFHSPQQVANAMAAEGFRGISAHSVIQVVDYPSVEALMRELKGLGAHNLTADRPRHLMGKHAMRRMMEVYRAGAPDGRIRASFEVIYAHGWRA